MEISAIQAAAAATPTSRRGSLDVPVQHLLAALAATSASKGGRRSLLETLSAWGSVAARVVGTNDIGDTLLEIAGTRIALRLTEARAPGETVLLSVSDASHLPSIVCRADTGLSSIARLLARLAATAETVPLPLDAGAPLAPTPTHTDALADALRQSLVDSGLFYESHLARWIDNDYRLTDIQREPQFRARLGGGGDLGPDGVPGEQPAIIAERLLPVLRQQLSALEMQTIIWNGMLWPGQHGEIEIQQKPAPEVVNAADPAAWIMRINLALPRMGLVEASVVLSGDRVALSIAADSAETAVELAASRSHLETALAARGIQSGALMVRHREA